MKLLSIVVPCYNSQDYLHHCIDSLLTGGDAVEIIIVNDGSSDQTATIAEDYQARYPGIVRAIHQENGGHGEAVNTGIKNASGMYLKVVDSDDWVNGEAYEKIIQTLKQFSNMEEPVDMLISNYVYENNSKKNKKVVRYEKVLPEERVFQWKDTGHFRKGQYMLMHSVIYRTNLLRDCGLKLPKHTFYVDNLFVFIPLPYVKSMYYLNVDFYRYFIGREDQSVNEKNMCRHIDQQLKVNRMMLEAFLALKTNDEKLYKYMYNYLEIITIVSSAMLIRSGTKENLMKKRKLWEMIRNMDPKLYRKLRMGIMGQAMNLPGKSGRAISVMSYKISQKVIGFN